jgi:hypothetical protein
MSITEVTGDDILDNTVEIEIYIPANWTGEYVATRMILAFETLRRIPGRSGPQQFGNGWPEYMFTDEDLRGRADDHRKFVWDRMVIQADRFAPPKRIDLTEKDYTEFDLMDEALSWPLRYLQAHPLHADAINIWAMAKAFNLDIDALIASRRRIATGMAETIAAAKNMEIAAMRAQARRNVQAWMLSEHKRRKIVDDAPVQREKRFLLLHQQGRARLDTMLAGLCDVKPDPREGMPGKIVGAGTLKRVKMEALAMLADRLHRAGVAIR